MPHTEAETLIEAKKVDPRAHEVSPTHPEEDSEWWIADANHDVFAVGTWGDLDFSLREYKP